MSLHNQRLYLKSIGLCDEECQMLMDKVMAYNELYEGSSANNVSLGFTSFIISAVATILLLMFNIYLIEGGRIWFISIVLNIVAFLFGLLSIKEWHKKGLRNFNSKTITLTMIL